MKNQKVLGEVVQRRLLTPVERAQAVMQKKESFPQEMPCLQCGHMWMQHSGSLCPSGKFGMAIIADQIVMIPPDFKKSTTTFLPDVNYFNTNPDFDVA